jgi:hypothetical protein
MNGVPLWEFKKIVDILVNVNNTDIVLADRTFSWMKALERPGDLRAITLHHQGHAVRAHPDRTPPVKELYAPLRITRNT